MSFSFYLRFKLFKIYEKLNYYDLNNGMFTTKWYEATLCKVSCHKPDPSSLFWQHSYNGQEVVCEQKQTKMI